MSGGIVPSFQRSDVFNDFKIDVSHRSLICLREKIDAVKFASQNSYRSVTQATTIWQTYTLTKVV